MRLCSRHGQGIVLNTNSSLWSFLTKFDTTPGCSSRFLQDVVVVQFHKKAAHSLEHGKLACLDQMNRTDTLVKDVNNYDILFHTGDLSHANGYMSEWDQFSGGALYIMFENHVHSWPLLKTPCIREVICLDTFVYRCIPFYIYVQCKYTWMFFSSKYVYCMYT